MGQAQCLIKLAQSLCSDNQSEAAEEAILHANNLFSEKGDQFELCDFHHVFFLSQYLLLATATDSRHVLGGIYQSKGETEKAIHHFEVVFGIASPFSQHDHLFLAHYYLARLFCDEGRFDDANTRIERPKSHTANSPYYLGLAMELQAKVWYR